MQVINSPKKSSQGVNIVFMKKGGNLDSNRDMIIVEESKTSLSPKKNSLSKKPMRQPIDRNIA
jgi:hypothetical protein